MNSDFFSKTPLCVSPSIDVAYKRPYKSLYARTDKNK
jgi:hypothetical protein